MCGCISGEVLRQCIAANPADIIICAISTQFTEVVYIRIVMYT